MTEFDRRQVLVAGLGALVTTGIGAALAGCTPITHPPASPSPTPTATPPDAASWASLAAAISGRLLMPADSGYETARLIQNPRFDAARPLAVLTANSAADVSAAVTFAAKHGVPLALRSGGHSYPGYSAGGATAGGATGGGATAGGATAGGTTASSAALVIDTRGMTGVTLSADHTVRIGAGASLARVYDALGTKGRAIAAGSCPTVGITGLTLGGGVGVLVRAYGLTCDSLTAVEIVTADGAVRTASATENPDLFWACRGGGGGHLGVVTALTFATRPAPTVTMFSLGWRFPAAAAVIAAWQDWAPHADPQLWSTLKLLGGTKHPNGPGIFLSGTWLGEPAALNAQLASFLARTGAPTANTARTHSYHDAMMIYAGCAGIPIARCQTGAGGALKRESFAATSHIASTPLDAAAIGILLERVTSATSLPGLVEGGISMDALGGAVSSLAPDATAFIHRAALMTVQYTATFADGATPAPFDSWVRAFRSALIPAWGTAAYVNYADADIADPAQAYFGANAAKLRTIAAKYDAKKLFTQPQA